MINKNNTDWSSYGNSGFYTGNSTLEGLNSFSTADINRELASMPSLSTQVNLNDTGVGQSIVDQYTANNPMNLNFGSGSAETSNGFLGGIGDSIKGLFSTKDPKTGEMSPNYAGAILGLLEAGMGFYLGDQQIDLAEDSLSENKRQFNTNYNAQKTLINDQLKWQHNARLSNNPDYAGELAQIS